MDGVQAPDVSARVEAALVQIRSELPSGYRIDAGGAIEESKKSNKALFSLFRHWQLARFWLGQTHALFWIFESMLQSS